LFRRVISIAPENATGYRNLAGMFLLMGRYNDAIPLLVKSLDLKPAASGYSNLGSAYYAQGRYTEAVAAMEKAVEQQPRNYILWGNLGDARGRSAQNADTAILAWRRAADLAAEYLNTHADEPQALSSLAVYRARLHEQTSALTTAALARKASPRDPRVLRKSALVYEFTGRRVAALTALQQALAAGESKANIGHDPDFAALRADASCAQYLTKEVCSGHPN
jgi:tetratricopeptide (TPR) repeat protein